MLLRLTESTRNPRITPKAIREYFCFLNKLHSAEKHFKHPTSFIVFEISENIFILHLKTECPMKLKLAVATKKLYLSNYYACCPSQLPLTAAVVFAGYRFPKSKAITYHTVFGKISPLFIYNWTNFSDVLIELVIFHCSLNAECVFLHRMTRTNW